MHELEQYFSKAFDSVKPIWAFFVVAANYILFPDAAYIPAAGALGGAVILDIITKYYALGKRNGGILAAFRTHKINSESFWEGTKIKLFSYLSIMILAGLSVRVTMLDKVAVFLATVAYSIMFLRESQSVMENLIDAGATWLEPLLNWTKRKQEKVLDQELTILSSEALEMSNEKPLNLPTKEDELDG